MVLNLRPRFPHGYSHRRWRPLRALGGCGITRAAFSNYHAFHGSRPMLALCERAIVLTRLTNYLCSDPYQTLLQVG